MDSSAPANPPATGANSGEAGLATDQAQSVPPQAESGSTPVAGEASSPHTPPSVWTIANTLTLSRMALAVTGARGPAEPDEPIKIRFGTGFLARFATGDPYVPFGPFLSVGAFVAAFWPWLVPDLVAAWRG